MPSLLGCLFLPIAIGIWQAVDADAAPLVTCGSVVKLQHANTGVNLHSHEISYGSGSGQQSVTGYTGGDDANDYWAVRGSEVDSCPQGTPLSSGSKIKLYHSSTQKWLHSHLFPSPLTNNQEVSAFGSSDSSDTGDIWILEWDKSVPTWQQDQPVKLKHADTSTYLSSHSKKFNRPITGQQEICTKAKSKDANWLATEGVYFPAQPQ